MSNAKEIIRQILALPPEEKQKVIDYVFTLDIPDLSEDEIQEVLRQAKEAEEEFQMGCPEPDDDAIIG